MPLAFSHYVDPSPAEKRRDAARAAQKRRKRPRLLLTAYALPCSGSTLGTLERCQRPRSASPANSLLVLDAPSTMAEGKVVLNVAVTHMAPEHV